MAIRSRLKEKIKALLGTSSTQTAQTTVSPIQASNNASVANKSPPVAKVAPVEKVVEPPVAKVAPVEKVVEPPVEKSAVNSTEDLVVHSKPEDTDSNALDSGGKATAEKPKQNEKVSEEKILKHLLRTKKGLMKFIQKQGGTTDLATLHHHSEMRFLIGHKKFSSMMEEFVAEEWIVYDWTSQEAVITEKGIQFSSS